ncbi:type VI secretion-associated protein, ImpA family [Burkholderiales bacterium JOSHI_001]|nr:type VI secretion-associated protein, ImpA family [Burkholderiales bacterium JOSHI_001]
MIDIEALAKPVAEDNPVGENTEYTDLAELERLAAGTPGTPNPETQELEGGEEPDWRKVSDSATSLLTRTKDLRAACILARAALAVDGLAGLGAGLTLLARLLTDFWDGVYPQLDKDENDDPIERLNALAYLCDISRFIAALRAAPFAESREIGRFTARDLDLATGRLPVAEGATAPTEDLIAAAWRSGDEAANQAKRNGVDQGLAALAAIDALFRDRTSDRPDLDVLRQTLKRLKDFYDAQAQAVAAEQGDAAAADGSIPSSGGAEGGSRAGALSSRADAVRILKQVSDFLRRSEPSSPAPMFIDRAIKVMQMDFASIVKELMPDAKERIELLGGVPLDPPSE